MIETYNIANDTTGIIEGQLCIDLEHDADGVTNNTPSGFTAYLGDVTDTQDAWYYVAGVKTARPKFLDSGSWNKTTIVADGSDTATFTGLPNPTTVIVSLPVGSGLEIPGPIVETSGSFSLTTPLPGVYLVLFDSAPREQLTTEITAT